MLNTVIGILLIIMAVFLVIAVLMQSSKDHRHGGTVAGGAETFFGKNKGKSLDALFNKLTTVIAIIFVVLVVVLYVVQPEADSNVTQLPQASDEAQTTPEAEDEQAPETDNQQTPVVEGEDVPVVDEEADGAEETNAVEKDTDAVEEDAAEVTEEVVE